VKVETEGTLRLLIGDRQHNAYHDCPDAFERMIRITKQVLDALRLVDVDEQTWWSRWLSDGG
jgi:hypothetical protein